MEYLVAALANGERGKAGRPTLVLDDVLCGVARLKSLDMSSHDYCGHESPVFGSTFDMLMGYGFNYLRAGENVAMGFRTPEAVMAAWMSSPDHREIILKAGYDKTGVGVIINPSGTIYWTQLFIKSDEM